VSSIDYKFQPNVTRGARFGFSYQPGTFMYRLDESTSIFSPKFSLDSQVLIHTHSPPHTATIVGIPSYDHPDVYTVKFSDGSLAEYSDTSNVMEAAPVLSLTPQPTILPHWIQGGANATLFLHKKTKPKHGKLFLKDSGHWLFCHGTSSDTSSGIILQDLPATCQSLLDSGQLFQGHTKFQQVYNARNQVNLQQCVLHHVSAHGLTSLLTPSSLKSLSLMNSNDQRIWGDAYSEEYDGLASLPTWEVLTEKQFKQLSKGIKALPSMAIATIKYDALVQPKQAKYRIVVLGNHDYHTWSKAATTAPVMSQLELQLLTSLAVFHKQVLKNCDVKQAFVQFLLTENETYFVKPPAGCPKSSPGTYWK